MLYGSYYFLDRYLGVRWLTPEVEVVPKKSFVKIDRLDYHGKPSFNARILQTAQHRKKPVNSIRWSARNFINSGFANVFETDPDYGEELVFSPPASCHGLFHIIKPAMFFKDHPEFWALQDGKRTHRDKRGLTADYCLTNEKLAGATAAECRKYLAKNPTARYISIQEGDFTRGYCECTPCKELVRKCGNRESGRWVFFANKVAKELKKDFPKTKLLIFAYTASRQPPENIKADDNVCVQLCAWNNRRGLPYDHPKNRGGRTLLKQMQQWKQVCKNVLLWDYTYGYADRLMQTPDLLNNVENFKSFKKIGADGIFAENGAEPSDRSNCPKISRRSKLMRKGLRRIMAQLRASGDVMADRRLKPIIFRYCSGGGADALSRSSRINSARSVGSNETVATAPNRRLEISSSSIRANTASSESTTTS